MKIEQQVVSLELSRQLKELGVKQNSSFYWVDVFENLDGDEECWQVHYIGWFSQHNEVYHPISAPTSSELGEILPEHVEKDGEIYSLRIWKDNGNWEVVYIYHHSGTWNVLQVTRDEKLADAMAQMKIYLLENKIEEADNDRV